jgi:hypothetical protein
VRVADLAVLPTESIWVDVDRSPKAARPATAAVENVDVEHVFEEFKRGVATPITIDDAESHYALSRAYVEMGLFLDARREAALVIAARSRPADAAAKKEVTEGALNVLLSAPLLRRDGLERLRERLSRTLH